MKKTFSLLFIGAAACVFQSCSGDHASNNGVDSVRNIGNYNVKINLDTAAMTTNTGSATLIEDGGSGGTGIMRDTMKRTHYVASATPAAPAAAPADTAKAAKKDSTVKK